MAYHLRKNTFKVKNTRDYKAKHTHARTHTQKKNHEFSFCRFQIKYVSVKKIR